MLQEYLVANIWNHAYSRHPFCEIIILRLIQPIAIARYFVYMNNEQFIILIIYSYKYRHDRKHYRWWWSKMNIAHNSEGLKEKCVTRTINPHLLSNASDLHFAVVLIFHMNIISLYAFLCLSSSVDYRNYGLKRNEL